uniref:Uncharacterized protein n=1 Tax=Nelumbo nucifera TaxID=4432 RepID=A0A822Z9E4_NELNU|nr:TPA_asm: hypothetical protein HUJ06_015516 [Nelumbo nucifera]
MVESGVAAGTGKPLNAAHREVMKCWKDVLQLLLTKSVARINSQLNDQREQAGLADCVELTDLSIDFF